MRGDYLNKIASQILDHDVPATEEPGFKRYIRREPVGVVLVIFAWNVRLFYCLEYRRLMLSGTQYPYLILVNSLLPALLAGNAVILKPSPQTPTIVEHVQRIFESAGLPKNVIQYFHAGNLETVASMVRNPLINHICFTGSVAGGLAVQQAAADRIVNVGLELGGKDPAYVREDIDPKWASVEIVDGAIFNSGQSCCAIERVYVASAIYDEFLSAVKDVLAGYKVGDPMDKSTNIGPTISNRSKDTILAQIKAAIDMGARDETPANPTFDNLPGEGNYVKPTLLTGVTHKMQIMQEETFGPVIAVMKVSSDDEAINFMNDSEFGLTASIWTKDVAKGESLAGRVEAGTVFVSSPERTFPPHFLDQMLYVACPPPLKSTLNEDFPKSRYLMFYPAVSHG